MENKHPSSSPAGERENIMGTMDINPLLIKLSVPMMVSMLVQALYNVVDSIFVSHVSESALTAVSLAFSLQNVMIAVGVGTGVGVNALLSKSLGEKNQSRANATAENGIFLSLCSFAVFFVIGLTCMKPYFYAQTSDPVIAQQGIQYLSVCCIFSLGLFTQTMGEKLLAATGRTYLSMISQLVGAVVNIILDPIFIFGYCGEALSGTTGAAAATVIGQFCGMADTDKAKFARLGRTMHGAFNPDRPVDEMALEPALADELRCALDEGALLSQADAAVAEQALAEKGLSVPVLGMVKDDRHRTRALMTARGQELGIQQSPPLFALVGQVQEEVHRFAITYHRKKHSRSATRSRLEGIPGLGEVRRKKLLQQFGTVKAVTQAELPELEAALPKAVALAVYERFHGVEDK